MVHCRYPRGPFAHRNRKIVKLLIRRDSKYYGDVAIRLFGSSKVSMWTEGNSHFILLSVTKCALLSSACVICIFSLRIARDNKTVRSVLSGMG